MTSMQEVEPIKDIPWPVQLYDVLRQKNIRHCAYVPDAGHSDLINRMVDDEDVFDVVLSTEEEGIGYLSGAWLGGDRGVLLMQCSGVGNCINMLSLTNSYRIPLLMIVTMRGEWAEFNPMQVPMGRATEKSLEMMGVNTFRVDDPAHLVDVVGAAADLAFNGDQTAAVIISQRVIGRKVWTK